MLSLQGGRIRRMAVWAQVLAAVIAAFLRVAFYFVDESQGLVKRRQRSVDEAVESAKALRRDVEGRGPRRSRQKGQQEGQEEGQAGRQQARSELRSEPDES